MTNGDCIRVRTSFDLTSESTCQLMSWRLVVRARPFCGQVLQCTQPYGMQDTRDNQDRSLLSTTMMGITFRRMRDFSSLYLVPLILRLPKHTKGVINSRA